jgi:menaquinol-cytochrome c reductase iron-sulfur subunit
VADSGNDKQGAPRRLEKPEPPGYFEGESMTRRKAFTLAGGAVGGIAGAAIVLPAIGFAVAPLFEQEKESWQAVGATSNFSPDT